MCCTRYLYTQWVLVYLDGLPVEEDLPELWPDGPQVGGHDEGGRQHAPHRHLGPRLVQRQAVVPDNQLNTLNTHYLNERKGRMSRLGGGDLYILEISFSDVKQIWYKCSSRS